MMTGHSLRRRLLAALRDDRGSASSELVVATPLLLLMLMTIVQFTVWSHATHVAQAAATEGLAATRAQDGDIVEGRRVAAGLLDQLARGPLVDPAVDVTRNGATAAVVVTGTATTVVPLVALPVRAEARGPVERFSMAGREG